MTTKWHTRHTKATDNYPNGELVGDAKAFIENLGVSVEELIKIFEAGND